MGVSVEFLGLGILLWGPSTSEALSASYLLCGHLSLGVPSSGPLSNQVPLSVWESLLGISLPGLSWRPLLRLSPLPEPTFQSLRAWRRH